MLRYTARRLLGALPTLLVIVTLAFVLLHAALNELGFDGSRIRAEAGVASPKVSRYAAMHDRADAEFLSGCERKAE